MKVSKYWLFQIVGWLVFGIVNTYVAILTREISLPILCMNILLLVMGILFSHIYRNIIVSGKWMRFSTEKIIRYIFIGTAVLSAAYIITYYGFRLLIMQWLPIQFFLQQLIGTYIAVFVLFLFWNAIYFSWNYIERNRQLLINRLRMESELKDLEIKTIKANLQPHFIFNSLNSIRALIDEDPKLAREAVTKISNILRSSISQQKEQDTLANEITLVEDYLTLEKIRFEERLQFKKNIDATCLQFLIPTMMLQTLVENAIKHGISASEEGGEILLNTKCDETGLTIEVWNTGELKFVPHPSDSLSFGLNATKQRLHYFYKDDAHFTIQQENKFVKISIHIKHPIAV